MENEILDSSVIEGTSGNDRLEGTDQDDTFFVGRGNDFIDGGEGQDVLNVDGDVIEWTFTTSQDGSIIMTHPTWGQNFLSNVESIFFARSGQTLTIEDAISATEGLPAQRIDDDNVINGTNLDDVIVDTADVVGLYGGVGNDSFQGDPNSFSQVNYDGNRSEYTITENTDGSLSVLHPIWGADRLTDIDALIFTGREPGVDGAVTGEFEFLSVSDIVFDEDIAGDASTTTNILFGETVTSEILGDGDSDWIAFTLEAGETINFSNTGTGSFERAIVDADGTILVQPEINSRGGQQFQSDIQFQAEDAGTFFFATTGVRDQRSPLQEFAEGSYTLTATEISDDFGNFVSGATQLNNDDVISGDLEYLADIDTFTITLTEGDTLNLTFSHSVFSSEFTLSNADGEIVETGLRSQTDFDANLGLIDEIDFTAIESGDYIVTVASDFDPDIDFRIPLENRTGEYELTANIEAGENTPDTGISDGVTLAGGAGNDDLRGDSGDDILSGEAGNDFLVGGAGADKFILAAIESGTSSHDTIADFEAGVDVIDVSALANISSFDDLNIVTNSQGYVSIYLSESNSVTFTNLSDPSELSASDFLFEGNEEVVVDEGNIIEGTAGEDFLTGGAKVDLIDGGSGNDLLVGGAGDDIFIFTDHFGYDTIADFGNGNDVIDLSSTDFEDFNDLNLVEKDGSVFIYVDENNSVEITNIDSIEELSADDFVF